VTDNCDVLVVGGGIHGVGVAQAAAAAGYEVILVEKNGLASGTSSRSSKLIHGGLRYLESYEFGLVRECLTERRLLLELAPDLVRLEQFHIPLYAGGRRPEWELIAGLSLYALLAGFGRGSGFARLRPAAAGEMDGVLKTGLKAVYRYQDARTDDAALTRAVMASARRLGARLIMPIEFVGARLCENDVVAHCASGSTEREIHCRVLVNATGAWVRSVSERIEPRPPVLDVDLIQGTHLVLPDWQVRKCYYLESPRDGRAIFVLPWRGGTMVGTTETHFAEIPDDVRPRPTERRYLRSVIRHYFPDLPDDQIRRADAWAGLRVLPAGDGHAFHRTRETRYVRDRQHNPRVLSIYGGKLTAYRATADKVMKRIRSSLPERNRRGNTRRLRLEPVDEVVTDG
jgi:glycerol-3-phosphate dehydrogenase